MVHKEIVKDLKQRKVTATKETIKKHSLAQDIKLNDKDIAAICLLARIQTPVM